MSEKYTEKIPQHRHCLKCGKAFTGDGEYCGPDCEKGRKDEIKKKKNFLIIIWVLAVLMMVYAIMFMS